MSNLAAPGASVPLPTLPVRPQNAVGVSRLAYVSVVAAAEVAVIVLLQVALAFAHASRFASAYTSPVAANAGAVHRADVAVVEILTVGRVPDLGHGLGESGGGGGGEAGRAVDEREADQ